MLDRLTNENIFLLEFLVDKCMILPCGLGKEILEINGELCVCFKFMNHNALDICEADFNPKRDLVNASNTKSGKSCLFALSPQQTLQAQQKFNVEICVFKKIFCDGIQVDKLHIGNGVVPIACLFKDIINMLTKAQSPGNLSKTMKECYDVTDHKGKAVALLDIFIRLSCFGKLIVTQFQMNLQEKSVFFKDKEGKSLYKYGKASKGSKCQNNEKGATASKCKPLKSYASTKRPVTQDQFTYASTKRPITQDEFTCCGEDSTVTPYDNMMNSVMAEPCPLAASSNRNRYEEIEAQMNGSSFTFRIHKIKDDPDTNSLI